MNIGVIDSSVFPRPFAGDRLVAEVRTLNTRPPVQVIVEWGLCLVAVGAWYLGWWPMAALCAIAGSVLDKTQWMTNDMRSSGWSFWRVSAPASYDKTFPLIGFAANRSDVIALRREMLIEICSVRRYGVGPRQIVRFRLIFDEEPDYHTALAYDRFAREVFLGKEPSIVSLRAQIHPVAA